MIVMAARLYKLTKHYGILRVNFIVYNYTSIKLKKKKKLLKERAIKSLNVSKIHMAFKKESFTPLVRNSGRHPLD